MRLLSNAACHPEPQLLAAKDLCNPAGCADAGGKLHRSFAAKSAAQDDKGRMTRDNDLPLASRIRPRGNLFSASASNYVAELQRPSLWPH